MKKTTITLADAVTALGNIVRRFGDDHKPLNPQGGTGCTYFKVENGVLVAVCIVGQYLADLGILRATTVEGGSDEQYGSCSVEAGLWNDAETMGVYFEEEARMFLRAAQQQQDAGETWGDSVRTALQERKDEELAAAERAVLDSFRGLEYSLPAAPIEEEPLAPWEVELLSGDPWASAGVATDEPPF